jgi:hypothetical protein
MRGMFALFVIAILSIFSELADVQNAIAAPIASVRSNSSVISHVGYRAYYDGYVSGYYRGYRDGYSVPNYPSVSYYSGGSRPVDQGGCTFGSYPVCRGVVCWRVCYW